ncbi:MAG: Heme exporter protein D [Pelagibacterales bacterium]|nr:Heme exporter protein D [Pelagibacterales bacterium]
MNSEFFILGGYGIFVWPAFIFTFLSCLTLYLRTKNQLQIQEKIFLNEYKQPRIINIQKVKEKKITKESLSGSLI